MVIIHPIILFHRGWLSSVFGRAGVICAYLFLFWLNYRFPPPVSIERPTPNLSIIQEDAPPENVSPPLPKRTAARIALITEILTSSGPDFLHLWTACNGIRELEILVLERWITIEQRPALSKVKDTELEALAWFFRGKNEGASLWEEAKLLDEENCDHALSGIASIDPDFALEVSHDFSRSISGCLETSITQGLARKDIVRALEYNLQCRSQYWKRRTYGHVVCPNYLENGAAAWARDSPREALAWIEENESNYDLLETIARVDRELVSEAAARLPTGNRKTIYLQALTSAKESEDLIDDQFLKAGGANDSVSFLAILEAATRSSSLQWEDWLREDRLNNLTHEKRGLARSVIIERMIHHSPKISDRISWRYYDDNSSFNMWSLNYREHWMAEDELRAIFYLEKHLQDDDFYPSTYLKELFNVTGQRSISDAFILLERFHRHIEDFDPSDYEKTLREFAKRDREALLTHAPVCGPWGDATQEALIYEWKEEDFPWCLKKIQKWHLEEFFFSDIYELNRPVFIEHFESLPDSWKKRLFDLQLMTKGADLKWLLEDPPAYLDQESLKRIRNQIAAECRYNNGGDLTTETKVILTCDFLSEDTRSNMAQNIVNSAYRSTPEEMSKWINKLPPNYTANAQRDLDEWSHRREIAEMLKKERQPNTLLNLLKLEAKEFYSKTGWSPKFSQETLNKIRSFSPKEAFEVITTKQHSDLPLEHQATLFEIGLQERSHLDDPTLQKFAGILATKWAKDEPVQAAKWALTLPRGKVRDRCLLCAYHCWCTWDTQEAEEWGKTLSPEDRKVLSLR